MAVRMTNDRWIVEPSIYTHYQPHIAEEYWQSSGKGLKKLTKGNGHSSAKVHRPMNMLMICNTGMLTTMSTKNLVLGPGLDRMMSSRPFIHVCELT